MPRYSRQSWESIVAPPHGDAYKEYVKAPTKTTSGEIVEKACIYGCGHCSALAETREKLIQIMCSS